MVRGVGEERVQWMMVPEKSPEVRRSWWMGCQARAFEEKEVRSKE
jgi:hypothetical protein